jgi:TonB family protein
MPTPTATEQVTSEAPDQPQPSETDTRQSAAAAETDAVQRRLARARSLAAIGRLAAAASELESLRASTNDESVKDVSRVLLMAIVVEMPDYPRAGALLDEAYRAHAPGRADDEATHSYFALAGQTVNSIRTHLERYRTFGINVGEPSALPTEAGSDLEQLRGLLEKVVEQAKTLHEELSRGGGDMKGLDAAALLEDAATVRMRIARNEEDRGRWQAEVSDARQHLFSSETRIASISAVPPARAARNAGQPAADGVSTTPASASQANKASQSKGANVGQKQFADEQKSSKKSRQKSSEQKSNQQATAVSNAQPTPTPQPRSQQPGETQQRPANNAATSAKSGGSPVSVGSLAGMAKQRVSPSYPSIARSARITGIVTVYLVVNEKGEVESVERATGPYQLQQAATDAARRWKFAPTVVDGQPVRVTGYLSFNFSL